jgi:hypothetical protein
MGLNPTLGGMLTDRSRSTLHERTPNVVAAIGPRAYRNVPRATSRRPRETTAPRVVLGQIVDRHRLPAVRWFVMHIDRQGSVFDEPVTWEDAEWQ